MFGGTKPTFGQSSTGTGFGFTSTAAPSPFGQTFGKSTTGFGQNPAFGQQNSSLFGANHNSGTGLFGSNTSAAFGSTTTTPTFGGFQQPSQNTSLFGTTQPNSGTNSLFGQTAGSAFGASKPSGFGFGQTQTTTSLFGQATTANTSTTFGNFGQNATVGGVFGSNTAFGQTSATGTTGTLVAKYHPSLGSDTLVKNGQQNTVNTKQHCITAMKEYELKSLEELRMEDYLANRKGPQSGTAQVMFNQTQPTASGLFGTTGAVQSTGLFGQQTDNKSMFGTNNLGTTGFGQSASGFSTTNQQPGGLFTKPFTTPSTSSGGLAFGTSGLFGQTTQTSTAFSQPSTGFNNFSTNPQQTGSIFGTTSNENKPAFNLSTAATSTPFGGFGINTNTNTTSGGLFSKPTTGFNAPFASSNLTPASGFSGFNNTSTAGTLFNNPLNKPAPTGFGNFGVLNTSGQTAGAFNFGNTNNSSIFSNANKPGGLFSNTLSTPATGLFNVGNTFGMNNSISGFGTSNIGSTNLGTNPNQPVVPIHTQIIAMASTTPYGDNPLFKDIKSKGQDEIDCFKTTNPKAHKAILDTTITPFKVSPKLTNVVKVKPISGSGLTKKSLFEGLEAFDGTVDGNFSLKPCAKRLIIKTKTNSRENKISISSPNIIKEKKDSDVSVKKTNDSTNAVKISCLENAESFNNETQILSQQIANNFEESRRESWLNPNALNKVKERNKMTESLVNNTVSELVPQSNAYSDKITSPPDKTRPQTKNSLYSAYSSNDSILSNKSFLDETIPDLSNINMRHHPTGIIMCRAGYYTIPSLDELNSYMSDDGTCYVPNFTVGREGYGNVFFNESIDVAGLNLDEIVHFRHKEVILYPDDEFKPPIGMGLNRKAQITLDQVWPHDKTIHEPIKDPERLAAMDYEGKLRRVCDKYDTRFIEYRPETGSWVFKVDHFSKYGLSESDEEENPTDPKKPKILPTEKEILKKKTNEQMTDVNQDFSCFAFELRDKEKTQEMSGFQSHDKVPLAAKMESPFRNKFMSASPTAIIALRAGMDPYKHQLMKSSFFNEDETDVKSILSENVDDRESLDQIVPNRLYEGSSEPSTPSLPRDSSSLLAIESSIAQHPYPMKPEEKKRLDTQLESFKSKSTVNLSFFLKPKVFTATSMEVIIPFEHSLAYTIRRQIASDTALFLCRKFKIGFGIKNSIIVCNTLNNTIKLDKELSMSQTSNLLKGRKNSDLSSSVIQYFRFVSCSRIASFSESITHHLMVQLKYCEQHRVANSDCPYLKSGGGTEILEEHYNVAKSVNYLGVFEAYAISIWSLCLALWGYQEELEGQDSASHITIMCRSNLFSEWLEENLVAKTSNKKKNISSEYLEHLFELLLSHKVAEACELAFNNDDAFLSLLISQISGGPTIRQLLQHQLCSWQEVEADEFIQPERLKILMLIAGIPLLSSAHGPINCLNSLNWLQALAIHFWYLCKPTSSITDAIIAYDSSYQDKEFYAVPPSPSYTEAYQTKSSKPLQDLRYHLLKLYSKRSHPLEQLLNPATYTHDPMDYRLSWLLLQILENLGYNHCSELAEVQIHTSFANQLENYGLWHWSIFVLLHIKDQTRRETCIQQILLQYVDINSNADYIQKENFIINDLRIPKKWIFSAKAVKAGYMRNYHDQVKYLLKAKQWSLAHEIIMQHLAHDAIVNDNVSYLYSLLIQFEDPRLVSNWGIQGQVLLDFIEMNRKFESLKTIHEGDIETRWESLKPQISDLCSRINLLPCPTAKHRLCQSEIAQKLACLIRGVLLTCHHLNLCLLIKLALEKLPLPQEYSQQELRVLLDTFVVDIVVGHRERQ